jgi:class 3 adenylate cyclase
VVVQAGAAQAPAEVALARRDPRTAVSAGRQAVRLCRDAGAPYETALAQVVVAQGSSALGDAGVARVELETARVAFEALGAAFDAASAAAQLAEWTDVVDRGRRVCRTFLFTDIIDSTRLVAAMGDEHWTSVLGWHDKTVRQLLEAHGGEEVKQRGGGDGLFATFPSADAAIACAVALQRAFVNHRREYGFAPYVRVGVHEAEATLVGRDYSGRGVHEAARVTELAGAGEIVASADTATSAGWEVTSPPELVPLGGLPDPVEIVRVIWDSAPA